MHDGGNSESNAFFRRADCKDFHGRLVASEVGKLKTFNYFKNHISTYFLCYIQDIRQYNNIDLSSEVSTVPKFVYTDEALLLVRQ